MKFGLRYLTHPTPKMVVKISKAIQRLMAVLMGYTAFSGNEKWVIAFGILGWLTSEIEGFFGEESTLAG